jgi:hypothetical protein
MAALNSFINLFRCYEFRITKVADKFDIGPPPPKKRDLDLLSAKLDASSAAMNYGHSDGDQDSHISPELVRDFISMSGTDARSLPPPPPEFWKPRLPLRRNQEDFGGLIGSVLVDGHLTEPVKTSWIVLRTGIFLSTERQWEGKGRKRRR